MERDDPLKAVKRRFARTYHRINLAYADLLAARRRGSRPAERRAMQAIERTLIAREKLEDEQAVRGLVVTPKYLDGFAVDLVFHGPGRGRPVAARVRSSASLLLRLYPPRRPFTRAN